MRNIYRIINSIETHLLTWGDPFDCNGQDIIICITGNPGVTDFYIEFAAELHKNTGLPVCVIGQAGHEEVPDKMSNMLQGQENLFNLNGQIQHKLDLFYSHLDKHSKFHLIGHSIGSWMILEALQKHSELFLRIKSINLLFPTLQKMAKTESGKFLNSYMRRFHIILLFLLKLFNIIPEFIKSCLVGIYLKHNSLPSCYKDRIYKVCNPKVCEKILYLAYDEMDQVTSLNNNIIEKVKHVTTVIYSDHDRWAPISYMEDLKCYEPSLQMKQVDIDHAFVLKSSKTVAEMVSPYIKAKIHS